MADAPGGRYRSPVNLGIGQNPQYQGTDPQIMSDMVAIYNAIHNISKYFTQVGPFAATIGSSRKPWQTMAPSNFLWLPAAQAIEKGNVIYSDGASIRLGPAWDGHRNLGTGIAITAGAIGDLVQMAIGPMIVNVAGVPGGSKIWGRVNDPLMYTTEPPVPIPVGYAIAEDAILIPTWLTPFLP